MGPLKVRGAGGVVWDMDVPRDGTHERERFVERIANGDLTVLDEDDVPIERNAVIAELEGTDVEELVDELEGMTVKVLRARSVDLGIDPGKRNKAEIIAAIRAHELEPAGGTEPE